MAPSPIPFTPESPVPQALDIAGIKAVVEAFRQGARRAKEAGFDVVEIHTAHGYLLNEFLSPLANTQTRALIDAQRKLAASLGIQLICFTANADANILEGFRRIIRLRKAGVISKTKRTQQAKRFAEPVTSRACRVPA